MRVPSRFLAFLVAPLLANCAGKPVNPCDNDPNGPACLGTCTGQCVSDVTSFGDYMVLLWSGPDGTTPPTCPSVTEGGLLGYLDTPPAVTTCSPACSCSPSSAACFPPSTLAANSAICPPSGTGTALDSPEQWSGACAATAVASADSVTIDPPEIGTMDQCSPTPTEMATITGGKTRAMRCNDVTPFPAGQCPLATNNICAYPNVNGFSVCLLAPYEAGDVACPVDWPVKHLYYDDAEACACRCADPVGDSCSTTVTVFGDSACSEALASASVSSDQPAACVNVAPGSALGGIEATSPTYHAGTCAPILTKNPVTTMCCLSP
jgi:hypothetical protein